MSGLGLVVRMVYDTNRTTHEEPPRLQLSRALAGNHGACCKYKRASPKSQGVCDHLAGCTAEKTSTSSTSSTLSMGIPGCPSVYSVYSVYALHPLHPLHPLQGEQPRPP